MAAYKALIKNYFDQKGTKYRELDNGLLSVSYNADNTSDITIILSVDEDEGKVEFFSFSIGQFKQEQFAQGLIACNDCNAKYRWVKFYINDDNRICVRSDAIIDESTCGEECREVIMRMVGIIDECFPVFMKARWS